MSKNNLRCELNIFLNSSNFMEVVYFDVDMLKKKKKKSKNWT